MFAILGALVASRKQLDIVGFVLLGTVTGVGGGTLRDACPVLWSSKGNIFALAEPGAHELKGARGADSRHSSHSLRPAYEVRQRRVLCAREWLGLRS